MSLLYVKSILAVFFVAAGLVAALCMFALMGRSERKVSPRVLGIRVTEPETLDGALRNALDSPLPALVEAVVNPDLYIKAVRRT